ncbi:hypothetical protein BP5796_05193 [Coleophoma crateriformis]|uniref:ATPase synthesis protein 25 n=1 Tax=Coleophoma crateriformis TaxID=565419 RepID=A0A3D8S2J3_9HELO|nr:hypothetical protein BP5796_05193 [Coleophoma crateriformis]
MVVGRAIRYTGCANCRLSLLRTFTSVAGLPIRPVSRSPARFTAYRAPSQQAQYSSRYPAEDKRHDLDLENPVKVSEAEINDFLGEENVEGQEELAGDESLDAEVSNVPWYMQVESPQMVPRTISDRQRIPDLPENPPQILEPLLQQISIDLGLDDLTLLDLRKLDPPPALGSNLLMILGTARSEKHLHVSADRLCRWLRSTYKLRPDADGLLGRNELKLRLKRKSRRAKLMGSSTMDDTDDGVRTGWVCVNVGVVEGPNVESTNPAESAGFVGFGRRTDGISIVVQMLTEEKRTEIDLEKLWSGILKRGIEAQTEDQVAVPMSTNYRASALSNSQKRGFHTSARPLSTDMAPISVSSPPLASLDQLQRTVIDYINTGNYRAAVQAFENYSRSHESLSNGKWKVVFLDLLCGRLQNMSHEEAMQALGTGSNDHASTDFLYCYYKCFSIFPTNAEWEARLYLHVVAREHSHDGYDAQSLIDFLSEMQLCGGQVSNDMYLRALYSLLLPSKSSPQGTQDISSDVGVEGALRLLDLMHSQGIDILTEEVYMALVEATESIPEEEPSGLSNDFATTFGLPSTPQSLIQERVHTIFNMLDLPVFSEESTIRLMELYARQRTWKAFWDTWRTVAREGEPRTPAMYACMFRSVAMMRNQNACRAVLRDWIPTMDLEIPKVTLDGDVRQAVMLCLKIADPHVEDDAGNPESIGEWALIWRKCLTLR